jgi:hypothetical protein
MTRHFAAFKSLFLLHEPTEFIAYIYEIAEKSPQKQFEGSMTMTAVMTL